MRSSDGPRNLWTLKDERGIIVLQGKYRIVTPVPVKTIIFDRPNCPDCGGPTRLMTGIGNWCSCQDHRKHDPCNPMRDLSIDQHNAMIEILRNKWPSFDDDDLKHQINLSLKAFRIREAFGVKDSEYVPEWYHRDPDSKGAVWQMPRKLEDACLTL